MWGGVLLQLVGCSFGRNSLQPPRVLHRRLCPAGSFGQWPGDVRSCLHTSKAFDPRHCTQNAQRSILDACQNCKVCMTGFGGLQLAPQELQCRSLCEQNTATDEMQMKKSAHEFWSGNSIVLNEELLEIFFFGVKQWFSEVHPFKKCCPTLNSLQVKISDCFFKSVKTWVYQFWTLLVQGRREAPTVSPKSLLISGAKNEPSGHGEVLLLKWQKDQQMWKHFPCTLPNFEGCKGATFSG